MTRPGGLGGVSGRLALAVALTGSSLPACAPNQSAPPQLAEQARRRVLAPVRVGWVSSEQPSELLPSAVALGGRRSGRVLFYLEFEAPTDPGRLVRANLLLEGAAGPGSAIAVELSRAEAPRGPLVSWSEQPQARYPRLGARLAFQNGAARLDVTELLLAERKLGEPLRILLRAEPVADEPVWVATGAAGGTAPRVETYWE
jgi:hypothetical protein